MEPNAGHGNIPYQHLAPLFSRGKLRKIAGKMSLFAAGFSEFKHDPKSRPALAPYLDASLRAFEFPSTYGSRDPAVWALYRS